jgi:hydroxymethylpyrimidine pyrophosphatase-like HAD family hydrolase
VERGVHVTICTGRMFSGTRHLAHRLGLDAPLCCVDGSHIVHAPSGRELHAAPLASAAAEALLNVLEEFGPTAFAFSDDRVFYGPGAARYLDYVRTWSEQTNEVGDLLIDLDWHGKHLRVTAVVALGSQKQVRAAEDALNERAGGLLQAVAFPAFRAPRSGGGVTWEKSGVL